MDNVLPHFQLRALSEPCGIRLKSKKWVTCWESWERITSESSGPDTWSPTININRDPRWGRNVEAGEDPKLAADYGAAYTKGLQQLSDDTDLSNRGDVETLACVFDWELQECYEIQRRRESLGGSVDVSCRVGKFNRDAGALGVMCSYNAQRTSHMCQSVWTEPCESFGTSRVTSSDTDSCQCILGGHPQGIDHLWNLTNKWYRRD